MMYPAQSYSFRLVINSNEYVDVTATGDTAHLLYVVGGAVSTANPMPRDVMDKVSRILEALQS